MGRWTVVALAVVLAGCASRGYDRGPLPAVAAGPPEIREAGPTSIQEALETRPQLRLPARVAVHFAPPERRGHRASGWRWAGADKDALLAIAQDLRAERVVDLFPLSDLLVAGQDLRSVRIAAARLGADALLVVRGEAAVERRLNLWAALNLTLVGAFVAPASEREVLFTARSVLYDVANEAIYVTAEAEATGTQRRPTMRVDEERVIGSARRGAVEDLAAELETRFRALKGL